MSNKIKITNDNKTIKKLRQPDIPNLSDALLNTIYNYVDSENNKGRGVLNATIVGYIDYARDKFKENSRK